jgi:Putative transposase
VRQVQARVRQQVLRAFVRRGLLEQGAAQGMGGWDHSGGFSLDTTVRIEGSDRAGRERLLRYCARPPFALAHRHEHDAGHLVYLCPKPRPGGPSALVLTSLELIGKIAALLRYFLHDDAALQGVVVRILLRAIERALRAHSPGSSAATRLGAEVFIHRFGSALNAHLHFHCCIIDGVFAAAGAADGTTGVVFHAPSGLAAAALATVQARVRYRGAAHLRSPRPARAARS